MFCHAALVSATRTRPGAIITMLTPKEFHSSPCLQNFPQNQHKRRQRRNMYRAAAKKYGINPNMANSTIKKYLQVAGHFKANPEELQKWKLEKLVSPQERYQRRKEMRAIVAQLEGKPSKNAPKQISADQVWPLVHAQTQSRMAVIESQLQHKE